MARIMLNTKQKKILNETVNWFYKFHPYQLGMSIYDIPTETYKEIESIKDFETIWQEINTYVNDKYLELKHRRSM